MTTEDERMREGFEMWARREAHLTDQDLRRNSRGYIWKEQINMFKTWQAALSAQPAPQEESDDLTIAYMAGYGKGQSNFTALVQERDAALARIAEMEAQAKAQPSPAAVDGVTASDGMDGDNIARRLDRWFVEGLHASDFSQCPYKADTLADKWWRRGCNHAIMIAAKSVAAPPAPQPLPQEREPLDDELAQFRNWSALAYRALDDAHVVLQTVEPESLKEDESLKELLNRIHDLAFHALTLNKVMTRSQLERAHGIKPDQQGGDT